MVWFSKWQTIQQAAVAPELTAFKALQNSFIVVSMWGKENLAKSKAPLLGCDTNKHFNFGAPR